MTKLLYEKKALYTEINSFYIANNYPPLYPLLNLILVPFLGLGFLSGRLISLFSILLVSTLLFLILKKETKNIYIALIFSFLFLHIDYIYSATALYRVDMAGVFFSFLGFYLFYKKQKIIFPIIAFLFAIYTKQSNIAALLAVITCIFITERKKNKAINFLILFLILFTIPSFILMFITKGEVFRHLVTYNANVYELERFYIYLDKFIEKNWLFLVFSPIYIIEIILKKKYKEPIFLYLLFSLLPLFASGKVGSSYHYLFEPTGVLSLASGLGFFKIYNSKNKFFYGIIFSILLIYIFTSYHKVIKTISLESQVPQDKALLSFISKTEGKILSEEKGTGYILLSGKDIYFYPFIMSQLAREKKWDQEKIINEINNKIFSKVLLNSDLSNPSYLTSERFTREILSSIRQNYVFEGIIGDTWIYSPKLQ
ncbi:MAG: hypothetical protein AB1397_02815 [bacterium]